MESISIFSNINHYGWELYTSFLIFYFRFYIWTKGDHKTVIVNSHDEIFHQPSKSMVTLLCYRKTGTNLSYLSIFYVIIAYHT